MATGSHKGHSISLNNQITLYIREHKNLSQVRVTGKTSISLTHWYYSQGISTLCQTESGLPGGSDGKESACNAGDPGSSLGSGRFPGGQHGYPPQYSCLENPMDEEPGRLKSTGLQRVEHDWNNRARVQFKRKHETRDSPSKSMPAWLWSTGTQALRAASFTSVTRGPHAAPTALNCFHQILYSALKL